KDIPPNELTVTAGNAPGLNDGASALVVVSEAYATAHGLSIMARITGYATGGGEPRDLIEANEAFAAQALADGRALEWDWDRVNVNGGAIALGHPIGASGARILT